MICLVLPVAFDVGSQSLAGQDVSGRMPPLKNDASMVPLLPERGLSGWNIVSGDATIEYENGELRGYDAGDRNAFLMSDRTWGDFILEGDVLIEPGGNSGWQIRSGIDDPDDPGSRLRGYQVEVETTDRRWSGGIYEEGRRGWLDPLIDDEEARSAFRVGEWNHYRIEADGIHLRTWVNGVPCGDLLDLAKLEGHLAFQVHTGTCDVRWRRLRIIDRGRARFVQGGSWKTDPKGPAESFRFIPPDRTSTLRFVYQADGETTLTIMDREGTTIATLALHEETPFLSGKGSSSRFPEVVPGAGVKIRNDERNELVIDLHQGRLTVLRDGMVIMKRCDLDGSRIGSLQMTGPKDQEGSIRVDPVQCLMKDTKDKENEK